LSADNIILIYWNECSHVNQFRVSEEGGLVVDSHMETSVPGVYAAGDVCTAGWDWAPQWQQVGRVDGCWVFHWFIFLVWGKIV